MGGEPELMNVSPCRWNGPKESAAAIDVKSAKQPIIIVKIEGQSDPLILPTLRSIPSILNKGDKPQNEAGIIQVRGRIVFPRRFLKKRGPDRAAKRC